MLIQESKTSGLTNKEFCVQRGVSGKSFYYWQKKLRTKLIEATAPQLVQLEPVSVSADLLQINFRGAELKLPVGVDMDAVSGILDTKGKQCIWRAKCKNPPKPSLTEWVGFLLVEALPQSPQNTFSVFWKRWNNPAATRFFKSLYGLTALLFLSLCPR